jgi:hypothetical protein
MMARPTPDILAQAGQGDVDAMAAAMGPQVMALDISAVRLDGGTQPRAGINQAVVEDYASDMEANGAEFPPVQVVYDGADYWLWDGFHRLHARKRNGLYTVSAIVRQGTRRDAVLLSVGANAAHGLRRTAEDKRRAVETLLRDPEWAEWSDREIGRRVGVDGKTVASHRARLSAEIPQIETRRVERQGTEYGMKQPQRPAAAAVGAQGSKYMTLVEMTAAIEDWSKSFETQREALDGLRIDWGNGGGSYLEDWEDVAPAEWQAHDLLAAIRLVREGLERAQAAAMPPAAKPLVPWEMMVLVEELVALEGVALDGVDEDWLFEYMTDRARSEGHTFTRAIFDMAMKLAIQRQQRDNERKERLANARAAALPAGAAAAHQAERALDRVVSYSYGINLFGGDGAGAALLEQGLCGKEQCECFCLVRLDDWRHKDAGYVQPDAVNAPRIVYGCKSPHNLAKRRRQLAAILEPEETAAENRRRGDLAARTKQSKDLLRAFCEEIGGAARLASSATVMTRLLSRVTTAEAKKTAAAIWEQIYWQVAEAACEETEWKDYERIDGWSLTATQQWIDQVRGEITGDNELLAVEKEMTR